MKYRKATENDILAILEMIADDELGKKRQNYQIPLPNEYINAFEKINSDENEDLIVVENEEKSENLETIETEEDYLSFIKGKIDKANVAFYNQKFLTMNSYIQRFFLLCHV